MAITYPLTPPNHDDFTRIMLRARNVVGVSESPFTLQQQVQEYPGSRWEALVDLFPMKRESAAAWFTFLLKLHGRRGTFLLGDPLAATARGVATGTPLVNGADQTGQTLVTDGWTPDTEGILRAGDYIQLGTGATARLHQVLNDADSDAGGNATLDIWPPLRSSPADNDPITVENCRGVFRLASNLTEADLHDANKYGFSFAAVEAL